MTNTPTGDFTNINIDRTEAIDEIENTSSNTKIRSRSEAPIIVEHKQIKSEEETTKKTGTTGLIITVLSGSFIVFSGVASLTNLLFGDGNQKELSTNILFSMLGLCTGLFAGNASSYLTGKIFAK